MYDYTEIIYTWLESILKSFVRIECDESLIGRFARLKYPTAFHLQIINLRHLGFRKRSRTIAIKTFDNP